MSPRGLLLATKQSRIQALLIVLLLSVLLSAWMLIGLETVPPHEVDESYWISSSRYFYILFIQRDLSARTWAPDAAYWIRQSPPIPVYTIGLAWWLAGHQVSEINQLPYDGTKTYTQNQSEGRAPADSILIAVRSMMALITGATILILFYLAGELGGWVGAGAAAWMMATSVMTLVNGRRAMSDEPLMFFSMLSLLLMYLAAKYRPVNRLAKPTWVLMGLSGLALGLAMGSKVNALFVVAALLSGWIAVSIIKITSVSQAEKRPRALFGRAILESILAAAFCAGIAAVVFVAINPSLYSDPLHRARDLIAWPTSEYSYPADAAGAGALLNLYDRWFKSLRNMLWGWYFPFTWQSFASGGYNWLSLAYQCQPWAALSGCSWTSLGLMLNVPLFAVGMVILLKRALLDRHASYYRPETIVLLIWAITIIAATSSLIPYAYDRYFYPLSPPAYLIEGLTVSVLVAQGVKLTRSLLKRRGTLRFVKSMDQSF